MQFRVDRGETWDQTARLRKREEYPPVPPGAWTTAPTQYWCYVPARPAGPHGRGTADFFIGKFEVSVWEWTAYINDPSMASTVRRKGPTEAKLVPRAGTGSATMWRRMEDGTYQSPHSRIEVGPVSSLSWTDFEQYVRWLNTRAGAAVPGTHALPSSEEWHEAAGGADARLYPWGSGFDWRFCLGRNSLQDEDGLVPSGMFVVDESPYQVRDLAGGVSEWLEDWCEGDTILRYVRGGNREAADAAALRASVQFFLEMGATHPAIGARLVFRPAPGGK
jgi:formylglycine-generating enzyme required for sulfatase activity